MDGLSCAKCGAFIPLGSLHDCPYNRLPVTMQPPVSLLDQTDRLISAVEMR
jgi:hypothetical protein